MHDIVIMEKSTREGLGANRWVPEARGRKFTGEEFRELRPRRWITHWSASQILAASESQVINTHIAKPHSQKL